MYDKKHKNIYISVDCKHFCELHINKNTVGRTLTTAKIYYYIMQAIKYL